MKKSGIIFSAVVAIALVLFSCGDKEHTYSGDVNQTLETIMNRKSVRNYLDKNISPNDVEKMLAAGMAAPSSKDRRPWHLISISDKAVLKSLGEKLPNASMLQSANKAIIVCGDSILSDNSWMIDCSAVTQNILLAAESMKIGAVWTAVYPYEDRMAVVNEFFKLPVNIKPLAIIPLGYPATQEQPKDKFDQARIHYNKW